MQKQMDVYKRNYLTPSHVVIIRETVRKYLDHKSFREAVMIGFSMAFETLDGF